jgi:hypothetical protein
MSPIRRAKIFELLEKNCLNSHISAAIFHPFKSETDLCQNRFPLSRKTTAGDFGQKTRGEVGFGFEGVGEATRNGR